MNKQQFMSIATNVTTKVTPAVVSAAISKAAQPVGAKTVNLPVRKKGYRLSDLEIDWLKFLVWGPSNSGKTRVFADLLAMGYKVAVLNTDVGLLTVVNRLRDLGVYDRCKENLFIQDATSHKDVESFLKTPPPELYEFDPDWLVWDGFQTWQCGYLVDYSASIDFTRPGSRAEKSEAEEGGYSMSDQSWGMVNRETYDNLLRFFTLHGSKHWHKIITCGDTAVKVKLNGRMEETNDRTFAVTGGAKTRFRDPFDFIIRTAPPTASNRNYSYLLEKQRESGLANTLPADFSSLWASVAAKQGYTIPIPPVDNAGAK